VHTEVIQKALHEELITPYYPNNDTYNVLGTILPAKQPAFLYVPITPMFMLS